LRAGGLRQSARLSLLAFHVGLWDEIGWPTACAARLHLRQSQRVRAGGSTTHYTPQVMLSSQLGLRWNQPAQVAAAIAGIQQQAGDAFAALRARPDSGAGWSNSMRRRSRALPARARCTWRFTRMA
jgi:hypothetical protein